MIVRSLGSGVYGEVVKCLIMNTEKAVAVKILRNGHAVKEAQREVLSVQVMYLLCSTIVCYTLKPVIVFPPLDVLLTNRQFPKSSEYSEIV